MQFESFGQCPAVFERVVATVGHHGGKLGGFRKGRDGRGHVLELVGAGADDPGAPWAEHPFVGAGNEEIAVHVREVDVLHAEAVYAIDHVEDAVLVGAATVFLLHQFADLADGQLHAAAGMHPGHAQYTGFGANVAFNRGQHFGGRDLVRVFEQFDLANLGAVLLGAVFEHAVGGVVLVFAGENFLIRAHVDARVNHRQAFGGAAGQGDLRRLGLQVATGPHAHLFFAAFGFAAMPVHGQARVAIEIGAMHLDGFTHGQRVRGHQEVGEVQVVRVLREQLAQLVPFVLGQRRGAGGVCGQAHGGGQGNAGRQNAGLLEE
ncbi:hypothetical protein D3C84_667290 [compost metagenome]